ncbi:MAG: TRAP transporter large permease [Pseudoflavonifractor sp.]|nr:TRAP transporter large permease [Pseudoflavonifractor sp.]
MTSPLLVGILGLIIFILFLFSGISVSFAMLTIGFLGLVILRSPAAAFSMINDSFTSTFASYTTTVVPMFVLMGVIAGYSGISSGLINSFNKLFGHFRGGVAMSIQCVCAAFGAVCGSIPATLATVGKIAYPEMKKLGYDDKLSTGCLCAGSTLAVLIPPSLTCITYSMVTNESVAKLFVSVIETGITLMLLYMLCVKIWVTVKPEAAPVSKKSTARECWEAIRNGSILEVFIVFIIAMGGLFAGFFTATEAGAVGVVGIFVVTVVTRKLDFKKFVDSLVETIRLSVTIYFLLSCATVYGKFFSLTRIPFLLSNWVATSHVSAFVVMLMITCIYLLLGMVIDANAMILLTIPIFYPLVVNALGMDGLWFGVYVTVVLGMALMSPPVAVVTYIMQSLSKVKLNKIFAGVVPFIICNLVMCVLLVAFPNFFLFLTHLIF